MEIGKQSIRLEKPVYVESWASVVGKKEGEGPLAPFFDEIATDVDKTPHAWYFQQAGNGIFARQALLALVLNRDLVL